MISFDMAALGNPSNHVIHRGISDFRLPLLTPIFSINLLTPSRMIVKINLQKGDGGRDGGGIGCDQLANGLKSTSRPGEQPISGDTIYFSVESSHRQSPETNYQ